MTYPTPRARQTTKAGRLPLAHHSVTSTMMSLWTLASNRHDGIGQDLTVEPLLHLLIFRPCSHAEPYQVASTRARESTGSEDEVGGEKQGIREGQSGGEREWCGWRAGRCGAASKAPALPQRGPARASKRDSDARWRAKATLFSKPEPPHLPEPAWQPASQPVSQLVCSFRACAWLGTFALPSKMLPHRMHGLEARNGRERADDEVVDVVFCV
ncbi:hypothetical protein IWZ01DRAFT_28988 [Phyllosticta capitalensis]